MSTGLIAFCLKQLAAGTLVTASVSVCDNVYHRAV